MSVAIAESARGDRGGGFIPNSIENILEVGCSSAGFLDDFRIAIVKDMVGTARSDKICIARTTCCNHIKAANGGQLDGVQADTGYWPSARSIVRLEI